MIIVEGPDGSGKTTLIHQLETVLGTTREPRAVGSDAKALTPMRDWVDTELNKGFGFRLYDRFALISSPMYSMLPNPTFAEIRDPAWLAIKWLRLRQIRPIIVLCLPPFESVRQNVENDPHNEVVRDHIRTIYDLYLNYLAMNPTKLWHYDYTSSRPSEPYDIASLLQIELEQRK